MQKSIFLVGFMGAGKSSFGKRLAKKMQYQFIDVDAEIEQIKGQSIKTLFEKHGETEFRKMETNWLKQFDDNKTIIATGGGLPCYNNNMKLIQQKGKSIYLELTPQILVERLQHSKNNNRPLVESFKNNNTQLLNFIKKKLADREPFYKQANHTIFGANITVYRLEQLIKQISIFNNVTRSGK